MIDGHLIINEDLTLTDNMNFYLSAGSSIEVHDGATFTKKGGFIRGCNGASWDAVYVSSGSTLDFDGVEIEDADIGIYAISESSLKLKDCIINNCNTGLYVNGPVNILGVDQQLTGNEFNNCETGVFCHRQHKLIIGSGRNGSSNFNNCTTGIESASSTLIVRSTNFLEFEDAINIDDGLLTDVSSSFFYSSKGNSNSINTQNSSGLFRMRSSSVNSYNGIILRNSVESSSIMGTNIAVSNYGINSSFGVLNIQNNPLITSSGGINGSGTIFLNSNYTFINNNTIENSSSGPAIYANSSTTSIVKNTIYGPYSDGLFQAYTANIALGGSSTSSFTNNNILKDASRHGVFAVNAPGHEYVCNQIDNFGRGIYNWTGSNLTTLQGNDFTSEEDLVTYSTIDEPVHDGNCFNGGTAIAYLDQVDLDESTFIVEPIGCLLPSNPIPISLFDIDPDGDTFGCGDAIIGSQFGSPKINDPVFLCDYLNRLDTLSQSAATKKSATIRILNLLRMIRDSEHYQNIPVPNCVNVFIQNTSLCGLQLILDTESISEKALYGSKDKRQQVNIQSAITFILLQQWQEYDAGGPGNSQQEKDNLYQQFQQEYVTLKQYLTELKQDKTVNNNLLIETESHECNDPIMGPWLDALKLLSIREQLEENDIQLLDEYARKCASTDGNGVHLSRSIMTVYTKDNYYGYDDQCLPAETEPRSKKLSKENEITIVPNPAQSFFSITSSDIKMQEITITDIQGRIVMDESPYDYSVKVNTGSLNNGLYIVRCKDDHGQVVIKKLIVSH